MAASTFPFEEVLNHRDPVEVMSQTQGELLRLLGDVNEGEMERRPAPEKWNLREIVCHLADCEVVWAWRLRYINGHDAPVVQTFDQDKWARMYGVYTFANALSVFSALRTWNLTFIKGLASTDREKVVIHPTRGEETIWTAVQIAAGHDLHHLGLIEERLMSHGNA